VAIILVAVWLLRGHVLVDWAVRDEGHELARPVVWPLRHLPNHVSTHDPEAIHARQRFHHTASLARLCPEGTDITQDQTRIRHICVIVQINVRVISDALPCEAAQLLDTQVRAESVPGRQKISLLPWHRCVATFLDVRAGYVGLAAPEAGAKLPPESRIVRKPLPLAARV
jgi:hypothetical protein